MISVIRQSNSSSVCAINDLSFDVSAGQILAVFGSNTAGKSTTTLKSTSGSMLNSHDSMVEPLAARFAWRVFLEPSLEHSLLLSDDGSRMLHGKESNC